MMRRFTVGSAVLLLAAASTTMAQTPPAASPPPAGAPTGRIPSPAPTPDATPHASYVLGPHDVITVAVVGRTDYSSQVQVQDDGTISLPLIGTVTAAGLSVLQLKANVEQRLKSGGYFRHPEVTVTINNPTSEYATLLGEVGQPGLLALDRELHLSEIIARAGGVRNGADTVTLTLPNGENREYSLRAIATNQSPDPVVAPGTKIFVQSAPLFYVYGQVGAAGSFPIEPGMTLRNALARAGGPSQLGSVKKIKIYRGDKVIDKPDMNMKIEPGDTIHVGERIF
jgi:polysaccharide export outer membrane protein